MDMGKHHNAIFCSYYQTEDSSSLVIIWSEGGDQGPASDFSIRQDTQLLPDNHWPNYRTFFTVILIKYSVYTTDSDG